MRFSLKRIGLLIVPFILAWPAQSFAAGSGAFHIFGSDAETVGKGIAFTGEADNPSAILYNPAGLTQLKGSTHVSFGSAVVQPFVDHTDGSGVETRMLRKTYFVPHLYAVSDFGMERVVFGLGTTSSWGLGTNWAEDSFSRYVATETELVVFGILLSVAYQVNDHFSFGLGGIYNISTVTKKKQILQAAGGDAAAELQGNDDGFGFTVSALYKVNDHHQFGIMYRSEIDFTFEGNARSEGLTNAGAIPYNAIFGGSSYSTAFTTDLTLPQSVVLGYSYNPDNKWLFNVDVQWMDWSSIESEKVNFPEETDATRLILLEILTGSDRDWKATFSFAVGVEYTWSERLRLRGGYYYNPTPIPEETFDTAVPTADSHGISLGFGYDINEKATLDFAWSGTKYENWNVDNTVGAVLGADIDGKYEQFINILIATLTYGF